MSLRAGVVACRRCSWMFQVAPGENPACPKCGYGFGPPGPSAAWSSAEHAARSGPPAPPAPPAVYARFEPPRSPWTPILPTLPRNLTLWLLGLIGASLTVGLLNQVLTLGNTAVAHVERTASGFNSATTNGAGPLGLLASIVGLASVVVGIIWVGYAFRAVKARWAVHGSTGLAVGSWFIPLAHLVLPYILLGRAWRACRGRPEGVFVGWAVCFALALAASYVVGIWSGIEGARAALELRVGQSKDLVLPPAIQMLTRLGFLLNLAAGIQFWWVAWGFQSALDTLPSNPGSRS